MIAIFLLDNEKVLLSDLSLEFNSEQKNIYHTFMVVCSFINYFKSSACTETRMWSVY